MNLPAPIPAQENGLTVAAQRWALRCGPDMSLRIENCLARDASPLAGAMRAALDANKLELRANTRPYPDADSRDFDRDGCWRETGGKWVIQLYADSARPSPDELNFMALEALGFYARITKARQAEPARPETCAASGAQNLEKARLPAPAAA